MTKTVSNMLSRHWYTSKTCRCSRGRSFWRPTPTSQSATSSASRRSRSHLKLVFTSLAASLLVSDLRGSQPGVMQSGTRTVQTWCIPTSADSPSRHLLGRWRGIAPNGPASTTKTFSCSTTSRCLSASRSACPSKNALASSTVWPTAAAAAVTSLATASRRAAQTLPAAMARATTWTSTSAPPAMSRRSTRENSSSTARSASTRTLLSPRGPCRFTVASPPPSTACLA